MLYATVVDSSIDQNHIHRPRLLLCLNLQYNCAIFLKAADTTITLLTAINHTVYVAFCGIVFFMSIS